MVRSVKRYGSRKLYDTEESRYVTLDEIVGWIRDGQEVRILDNETGEDATGQTLTQIIVEQGRRGVPFLSIELLPELIRRGEETMRSGVEKILEAGLDRLAPVRRAREEMTALRGRIEELEKTLADVVGRGAGRGSAGSPRRATKGRTRKGTGRTP